MENSQARAVHVVSRLAESLAPGDLDKTINALTQAAVEVLPGVDYASISVRHEDGKIRSHALTADFLAELDETQYSTQEGPCYDGVTSNAFTVCGDLRSDPRYPAYGKQAYAAGIRSQAGVRLFESPKAIGALNLYSKSLGALADVAFLAELFSAHARTAIAYAEQLDSLRQAVASRQEIGQAIGIVRERYSLPEDQAFGFLTRLSNTQNIKLREIAQAIVADAPLPPAT